MLMSSIYHLAPRSYLKCFLFMLLCLILVEWAFKVDDLAFVDDVCRWDWIYVGHLSFCSGLCLILLLLLNSLFHSFDGYFGLIDFWLLCYFSLSLRCHVFLQLRLLNWSGRWPWWTICWDDFDDNGFCGGVMTCIMDFEMFLV